MQFESVLSSLREQKYAQLTVSETCGALQTCSRWLVRAAEFFYFVLFFFTTNLGKLSSHVVLANFVSERLESPVAAVAVSGAEAVRWKSGGGVIVATTT